MELSVKDIIGAYPLLDAAKMGELSGKAQIKLVKIVRKLKDIVKPYEGYVKDAADKLKGEKHDEYAKMLEEWKAQGQDCKLTKKERMQVLEYFNGYNSKLDESLRDEFEKSHQIEFDKLSEEEFEQLLEGNAWSANQIITIEDLIKTA